MFTKRHSIVFLFLFFPGLMIAQIFEATYGGSNFESASQVKQEGKNRILLSTTAVSFSSDSDNISLMSLDSTGQVNWARQFGGTLDETPASVLVVKGGYVIGGQTNTCGAGGYDFFLMKVNAAGTILWQKTYGGINDELVYVGPSHNNIVIKTKDGGYAITGASYSYGPSLLGNIYLVKTDSLGNLQWAHAYGQAQEDAISTSVVQTSDGGYFITGLNSQNILCIRVNALGNMVWGKAYEAAAYIDEEGMNGIQVPGAGFVVSGLLAGVPAKGCILKIDASGNPLWAKEYDAGNAVSFNSIICSAGGGYIAAGEIYPGSGNTRVGMLKTDSTGNILWSHLYGQSTALSYGETVEELSGGGLMLGGFLTTANQGLQSLVVSTNSLGQTGCELPLSFTVKSLTITSSNYGIDSTGCTQGTANFVSQGPSNNPDVYCTGDKVGIKESTGPNRQSAVFYNAGAKQLEIRSAENISGLHIYNMLGEELVSLENIRFSENIDLSSLPEGIYIVRLNNGETGKVLINR